MFGAGDRFSNAFFCTTGPVPVINGVMGPLEEVELWIELPIYKAIYKGGAMEPKPGINVFSYQTRS